MTDFRVRIANEFQELEKELVIYSSIEKKNYLVEAGGSREFDIPLPYNGGTKHYLSVSVSPGVCKLPPCNVKLPNFARLTFVPVEKAITTISRVNSGVFLKIPGGLPNWQLHITTPAKSSLYAETSGDGGPDNVTVGEDEDGG